MVKFQKCTSLGQICVLNASPACSLLSWQFQLDEHRQLQLHTCETEPATSSIPTLSRFSSSDHGTSLWSEKNCWHHPGTSFLYINNFTSWIFLQYIYYVSTLLPSPLSNHHDFLTRLFLPPLGWSCCSLFFPFSQFQHQHEPLRTQPIVKTLQWLSHALRITHTALDLASRGLHRSDPCKSLPSPLSPFYTILSLWRGCLNAP